MTNNSMIQHGDSPSVDRAVRFFSDRLGFLMAQSRLKALIDEGNQDYVVLDVRHEDVYKESRIPSAKWIDADDLDSMWERFDKERINVIYCYSELCHRAARVCLAASLKGYSVMELHGGFEGWAEYPFSVES